ncbi:MAG: M48 family metalloprotease [Myxococcota bacterium]
MLRRLGAFVWVALAPLLGVVAGCEGAELPDVNIFTIQDDIDLGAQLADEIAANPQEYGELLPRNEYAEAYGHLDRIRDEILGSGEVTYADQFEWKTHLIHDDTVLNAFAAPGGYIYVYTGLIWYLEEEDQLAGVLGHEIAHADQRHSTQQLTKAYGIETLLSLIFGDDGGGVAADVASGLVSLEFSREDEAEADEFSVVYLCGTDYASNGAAGFFEKLLSEGSVEIPEFLSTHPSSDSRVQDINAMAGDLGCSTDPNPNGQYAAFLDSLPPFENGG